MNNRAFTPSVLFIACLLLQPSCGGGAEQPTTEGLGVAAQSILSPVPNPTLVPPDVTCPDYAATPSPFPADMPSAPYTAKAGTIAGAFSVTPTGEATYSMSLTSPPGRAGVEPHLAVAYNSAGGDGPLGMGFSLSGLSAVTRCPSNLAQDGRIREVRYDDEDNYCLDGKRLVRVAQHAGGTVEYRTFPDSFARILGRFAVLGGGLGQPISFEVHAPSGLRIQYGTTPDSRVNGKGDWARAWWAAKAVDPHGNTITYAYLEDVDPADGHTVEHYPSEIRYTGFDGVPAAEPERAVRFHYEDKDPSAVRTHFTRGMEVKSSRRLGWIDMVGPGGEIVRTYHFGYGQSEASGRMLLASVHECAPGGACKPPTRFSYTGGVTGFSTFETGIPAPFAQRASPMTLDLDGDGRDEVVIPDLADMADPISAGYAGANGVVTTHWNVAKNRGGALSSLFDAPASRISTDALPASLPAQIEQIQPELGTAIDYNQDGRTDVLVHDDAGTWDTWALLLSRPGGGFDWHATNVARPLPAGTPLPGLRTVDGSAHLADLDGDGVPDLVQCQNMTPTAPGTNDYQWRAHLWRPTAPGWEQAGAAIDALYRYPCNTELHTVDVNGDGKIDLLVKRADLVADHVVYHTTYDAMSWGEDGTWSRVDTGLPVAVSDRVLFLDVNGDGLVDAVQSNQDHRLRTYVNTGDGFAPPVVSLPSTGSASQDNFLSLATSLDYDGDGLRDVLVPMPAGVVPGGVLGQPSWAILRSTGSLTGPTFAILDAKIPFEPLLSEGGISIADPHGPRVADVDGDGAPDVIIKLGSAYKLFRNRGADGDLLAHVSDGMNAHDPGDPGFVPNVTITYRHLSDEALTDDLPDGSPERAGVGYVSRFDTANVCSYPRHCVVGPRRVVSRYALNNGADKLRTWFIKYRDGRYHRHGRGFLGFGSRVIEDADTGAAREEVFDNRTYSAILRAYPRAGHVIQEKQWIPPLLGQPSAARMDFSFVDVELTTVKTYGDRTYFVLPTKRRIQQKQAPYLAALGATLEQYAHQVEAGGGGATTVTDSTTLISSHDTFGNVLAEETWTAGVDLSLSATRVYENDTSAWRIGLLASERQCSTALGVTQCRGLERHHDAHGQVKDETRRTEDGNAETKLTFSFQYDRYGNLVHAAAKDGLGNSRASCVSYEPEGVFPFASKNAVGHVSYTRFRRGLGVLSASVDPNKLVTQWAHDGFGRVVKEVRPDGTATTFELQRTKSQTWQVSLHTVTTGGADETVEYDSVGRPIRRLSHGPQPVCTTLACAASPPPRIMERLVYDELGGHLAKRSVPTSEITPVSKVAYERWEHDTLGRMVRHVAPWGAQTEVTYVGTTIQIEEPGKPPAYTNRDALGRVKSVIDAAGGVTSYAYGPFGYPRSVTAPDGTVTTMVPDGWGRTTTLTDPNRGKTFAHYNGFGDLISSVDALGREVELRYDFIGRKVARLDREPGATLKTKTTWTWDTAPLGVGSDKALGELAAVESPDARTSFAYDALGRLDTSTLAIGSEELSSRLTYDPATGHVSQIAYPEPGGSEPFAITREHDAYGHLVRVARAGARTDLWRLTAADGAGRIQEERYGNGAATAWTYDQNRGRAQRILTMRGFTKIQDLTYIYDSRNNLLSRHDALQAQNKTEQFLYDALDRLRCAYFSDVASASAPCGASYTYDKIGNLSSKSDVGAFTYGDPTHPHAVTYAGGQYAYDAVGNQIQRPGASLTYTPFDLPRTAKTLKTATTIWFGYDGDERRVLKRMTRADGTAETLYFGDLYERATSASGEVEHRYHVHAAGRVVATVHRAGGSQETAYLHPDHLGSVETVTGAQGTVDERRSYDAFGKRRNPKWGDASPPPLPKTSKGYTGHESDDELGLVNMKGRIYDPRLARFLMPDPLTKRPLDGQSWNRYSYVRNNPLGYVDPSGFQYVAPPVDPAYMNDPQVQKALAEGGCHDAECTVRPPPASQRQEDSSQALAAGAAQAPNDTSTLGSGSGHTSRTAAISDCAAAGQIGCYVSQDVGSWFLEHGLKFQYSAAGIAVVAGLVIAWQLLPIVVEVGGPEAAVETTAIATRSALWSRAGPAVGATAAALATTPAGQQMVRNAQAEAQVAAAGAQAAAQNLANTAAIRLPQTVNTGFDSFEKAKAALGSVGPNFHWHHIVEQGNGNTARFGTRMIHNTGNLIPVEWSTHQRITEFYRAPNDMFNGLPPREAVKSMSFDAAKSFGIEVLKKFGVIP